MTSTGLSRQTRHAFTTGEDEFSKARGGEPSDTGSTWFLPGEIGHVEEGSLEEAIWRELGALPRSRRQDPC
jgi:hypothetical protein